MQSVALTVKLTVEQFSIGSLDARNASDWERLVAANSASGFMQRLSWARFKSKMGQIAKLILIRQNGVLIAGTLVYAGHDPKKPSIMVAPYGPVLPWHDDKLARECLRLILDTAEKIASELNIVSLRIEPRIEHPVPSMLSEFGTGACNLVPAETLLLDLSMDAPAILAQMKAKCRYNISLSARKGVQVKELQLATGVQSSSESAIAVAPSDGSAGLQPASNCSQSGTAGVPPASADLSRRRERSPLDFLYSMLEEASDRDDFYLEPRVFFETLLSEFGRPIEDSSSIDNHHQADAAPSLRLYVAEHEGDLLGALLMVIEGSRATYLYGGVSNIKRNLMPGYALQWKAILDAKSAGCTTYDFYGFDQFSLPGHAYARFSRFKRGFGGRAVRFIGAQDYVFMDRLVDNVVMFFKDLPDNSCS